MSWNPIPGWLDKVADVLPGGPNFPSEFVSRHAPAVASAVVEGAVEASFGPVAGAVTRAASRAYPSFYTRPFVDGAMNSMKRHVLSSARRYGRSGFVSNRVSNYRPWVPQRRYPRQFVRRSFRGDRWYPGSRMVFYERAGDWKKQFSRNF